MGNVSQAFRPFLYLKSLLFFLLCFSSWSFSINYSYAAKNKEKFVLYEENFSKEESIDFEGLYQSIGYEFKDEIILMDALFPLLPQALQREQLRYQQLEFLGDSVLGLIVRERVTELFPMLERGIQANLYDALICNRNLTSLYLTKFSIEKWLPYPGKRMCEYCNVVEAIIGAIYKDGNLSGLEHARNFIKSIMTEELINQKLTLIWSEKKGKLPGPVPSVLSHLEHAYEKMARDDVSQKSDAKSLLNMIFKAAAQDEPIYYLTLGEKKKRDGFIARVTSKTPGYTMRGFGVHKSDAMEDAAQNMINFIAKRSVFSKQEKESTLTNYSLLIEQYCQLEREGLIFTYRSLKGEALMPLPLQECVVHVGNGITAIGVGYSMEEARENACCHAFDLLIANKRLSVKSKKKEFTSHPLPEALIKKKRFTICGKRGRNSLTQTGKKKHFMKKRRLK